MLVQAVQRVDSMVELRQSTKPTLPPTPLILAIKWIGVTQSRTLAGAARMARDYLALDLGGDPESYDVAITPELDGDLAAEADAVRQAVREAEKAQRDAAAAQRAVARRLKANGLSGADIAAVLKVSTQRVSQLVNS